MRIIRRTRIKFFIAMAAILTLVVVAFCAIILISTKNRNEQSSNQILEEMIINMDRPLPQINRFDQARAFAVKLIGDSKMLILDNSELFFDRTQIVEYVQKIIDTQKDSGQIDNIKFLTRQVYDGTIIVCLDISIEIQMLNQLFKTVLLIGTGGLLILWVLFWFLSYLIIKPASDSFFKQKRFISEASHELKTPLSVILSGVELIQKNPTDINNQKWLKSIKEQTHKMSEMTNNLLTLSKIDEQEKSIKSELDLSNLILSEVLSFESIAYESNLSLQHFIDGNIRYKGDKKAITQAVAILCDNAIKYSLPNNPITISLKKQHKIVFSITNQSEKIIQKEIPLLFERFYRGSESRAKTSGTGLGLAILKTICNQNGFKISTKASQGSITFYLTF